jgi:hypothetical protein
MLSPTSLWTNFAPSADGGIAYEHHGTSPPTIRYWDGSTVHRVTDNQINDTNVSLCGTLIAWAGCPSGGASHIYWTDVAK